MAQAEYFLKLDGIDGESTDARHPNEILVTAWNFGANNPSPDPAGPGGGAGKVIIQPLNLTKHYDKASIPIFIACCSGQRIRTATLSCHRAGPTPFDFLTIVMSDVVVSLHGAAGSSDANGVVEQVALAFARIVFTYVQQGPTGQQLPPVTGGWDLAANRKV